MEHIKQTNAEKGSSHVNFPALWSLEEIPALDLALLLGIRCDSVKEEVAPKSGVSLVSPAAGVPQ